MCSKKCRCTRPCGRTSTRGVGREGGRSHQALGVVQLVSLLSPGPGCLLAPWGGMVRRFSQGHGDAHPCIPQVCTEASLPPPSGGTGVCSSISRPREVHQHYRSLTGKATLEVRTWWCAWWCAWWCIVRSVWCVWCVGCVMCGVCVVCVVCVWCVCGLRGWRGWRVVGVLLACCWCVVGVLLVCCWRVVGVLLACCWRGRCVVGVLLVLLVCCWCVVGVFALVFTHEHTKPPPDMTRTATTLFDLHLWYLRSPRQEPPPSCRPRDPWFVTTGTSMALPMRRVALASSST